MLLYFHFNFLCSYVLSITCTCTLKILKILLITVQLSHVWCVVQSISYSSIILYNPQPWFNLLICGNHNIKFYLHHHKYTVPEAISLCNCYNFQVDSTKIVKLLILAMIVAAVQTQCVLWVPRTDLWLLGLAAGPGRERECVSWDESDDKIQV